MAKPGISFVGDGATKQHNLTFPYLRKDHVKVYVSGAEVPYTWINSSRIELLEAPPVGAIGAVRRETPETPLHTIQNNRPTPASSYNEALLQAMYLSQENSVRDLSDMALWAASQASEAAETSVASKNAAESAASAAEAAAAAAAVFDPDVYYPKTEADQKLTDLSEAVDQKLTDLSGAAVHKDGSALSGGFTAISKNLGSSPASITLSPSGGNLQHLTNSGTATINAPTAAGVYTLIIEIVNGATAGAVTLSGFTLIDGDTLSTIAGHKFQIHVAKTNSAVVAIVKALQ